MCKRLNAIFHPRGQPHRQADSRISQGLFGGWFPNRAAPLQLLQSTAKLDEEQQCEGGSSRRAHWLHGPSWHWREEKAEKTLNPWPITPSRQPSQSLPERVVDLIREISRIDLASFWLRVRILRKSVSTCFWIAAPTTRSETGAGRGTRTNTLTYTGYTHLTVGNWQTYFQPENISNIYLGIGQSR